MLSSHISNTPLAVLEWDRDFRLIRWSPQAENIFGWRSDEILGIPLADSPLVQDMHPASRAVEEEWRLLGAIVRALQEDVGRRGARLTVVAIPAADEVYDDRWERRVAHARLEPGVVLDRTEAGRRLVVLAGEAGARAIDLLPELRRAGLSDRRLYYAVNHHWTAAGHRLVAGVLASPLGL